MHGPLSSPFLLSSSSPPLLSLLSPLLPVHPVVLQGAKPPGRLFPQLVKVYSDLGRLRGPPLHERAEFRDLCFDAGLQVWVVDLRLRRMARMQRTYMGHSNTGMPDLLPLTLPCFWRSRM
jgi:hypothetical protein